MALDPEIIKDSIYY